MEFSIWTFIRAVLVTLIFGGLGIGCVAHSSVGVGEAKTECKGESQMPTLTQPPAAP